MGLNAVAERGCARLRTAFTVLLRAPKSDSPGAGITPRQVNSRVRSRTAVPGSELHLVARALLKCGEWGT
jgi:hypothetical protein